MANLKATLALQGFFVGLFLFAECVLAQTTNLTVEEALSRAFSSSPEVKAAEAELKSQELQAKISISPFLPKLSVEAGALSESSPLEDRSGPFLYGVGRLSLYNGGLDQIGLRIGKIQTEQARARLELVFAQVSRKVIRNFSNVLFLDEVLKLKREAVELNRTQRQIAVLKAQGGLTSNADVYEFDFRDSALTAEIELLMHEKNLASRSLSTAMGEQPQSNIAVTGVLDLRLADVNAVIPSAEDFLQRSAVLDARTELDVAELEKKAALATWLPRVDFEARYGDMRFAEPEIDGRPAWQLGVVLSLPIFSGMETLYARQQASAEHAAAAQRLRAAQLKLKNDLSDQQEKLEVVASLLRMQNENIERAKRYYQSTLAEYRRGIKNSSDLSGATERLFQARERNLKLIKEGIITKLGLLDATSLEE